MHMRATLFFIILVFLAAESCSEKKGNSAGKKAARIDFKEAIHDFGEIKYGGNGTYEFKFTNKGKSPLVLDNVRSTCGCTVPEWTREPLNPSETGTIRVIYDTHRVGAFSKTLIVYSNASNSPVRIFIKGTVLPVEESPAGSATTQ
jgi:hypothetical protein